MMYRFNKETLTFEQVGSPTKRLFAAVSLTALLSVAGGVLMGSREIYTPEEVIQVNINEEPFSEQALARLLKKMNLKYPHIALAQAKIESGGYKSFLFRENNNLFGMREAKVRVNMAMGTRHKHAYYESWQESVIDYAMWCATYGAKCKTEDQFLNLLAGYAEASQYKETIISVVNKNNLKSKF